MARVANLCGLRSERYLEAFHMAMFAVDVRYCPASQGEVARREQVIRNEWAKYGIRYEDLRVTCPILVSNPVILNDLDAKYGQITLNYH